MDPLEAAHHRVIRLVPLLLLAVLRQHIDRQFTGPRCAADEGSCIRLLWRIIWNANSLFVSFALGTGRSILLHLSIWFLTLLRIAFLVSEFDEACVLLDWLVCRFLRGIASWRMRVLRHGQSRYSGCSDTWKLSMDDSLLVA